MIWGVIIQDIKYPCIIKPLYSIKGNKSDIVVIYDRVELEKYIGAPEHPKELIIQEYIPKKYEYQCIGASFNNGREIIIPGISKIIRPAKNSNTGFLHYEEINPSYNIELVKEFIRNTSYSGLFSVEFLRDVDDNDYFMEMNFRNDGNSICVTAAGVNLPFLWFQNEGKEFSNYKHAPITPVYVMPEIDDFILVLTKHLSLKKWVRDIRHTDSSWNGIMKTSVLSL